MRPPVAATAVAPESRAPPGLAPGVMVEIGGSSTDLAVYYDGKIRHVAVRPLGGSAVTADLVKGIAIPFAEAQRAKEQHAVAFAQLVDPQETVEVPGPAPGQRRHVSRELIAHIAEQRLDELFGMVGEELEKRRTDPRDDMLTALVEANPEARVRAADAVCCRKNSASA